MKKKREFREPKTLLVYAPISLNPFNLWHERTSVHTERVRIIRNADYLALARLARRAK